MDNIYSTRSTVECRHMGLQWNTDSNFTSDVLELNYLSEIHENHAIIVCAHSYFWGNSSLTCDFWSFTMIPMVLKATT